MPAGRKPDYTAFAVDGEGRNANWTRLGAAWENEGGITIQLNAHPIGNKVVLRKYQERENNGQSDDISF